ncbi:MAG: GNAT family N-acetyltransferase [Simkania negevensis]|nr:GNAT family N-acetyltransferase [Simkania negevensis]
MTVGLETISGDTAALPVGEIYSGPAMVVVSQGKEVELRKADGTKKIVKAPVEISIETENLALRTVKKADLTDYIALRQDPEVCKLFATGKTYTETETAHRVNDWIQRAKEGDFFHALSVFRKEKDSATGKASEVFVGYIVLGHGDGFKKEPEAGVSELAGMGKVEVWNQGLAKEAACAVRRLAQNLFERKALVKTEFEGGVIKSLPLQKVVATSRFDTPGSASIKILTSLGFKLIDRIEKWGHPRGLFVLNLA